MAGGGRARGTFWELKKRLLQHLIGVLSLKMSTAGAFGAPFRVLSSKCVVAELILLKGGKK